MPRCRSLGRAFQISWFVCLLLGLLVIGCVNLKDSRGLLSEHVVRVQVEDLRVRRRGFPLGSHLRRKIRVLALLRPVELVLRRVRLNCSFVTAMILVFQGG